jgi:hypothetical protein
LTLTVLWQGKFEINPTSEGQSVGGWLSTTRLSVPERHDSVPVHIFEFFLGQEI